MGTATLTRSQSRKTRSICSTETSEKGLSSPFVVLPGNDLDSSTKRRARKTTNDAAFTDKENAPPSLSRLTEKKGLPESSLHKVLKKRKQLEQATDESARSINADATAVETPVALQHESCRLRSDVEVAENPAESQPCTQIELLNDDTLPSAERTLDTREDQTEEHSRFSNLENSAREAAAVSMGDCGKDASRREAYNDTGAGVVPSSSALALLQKDYERLFSKYKKLKERRLDEVETLYNEQNSRIADFVQATEALIEFYKAENVSLKQQIEGANSSKILERCKCLERANVDCRNELLQEQAKGLELRQENKRLKMLLLEHIAEKQKQLAVEPMPVQGSQSGFSTDVIREARNDSALNGTPKLAHRLLECVLGLQLSCPDGGFETCLRFRHGPTGFSFDIKEAHDAEIAELVEGGELLYQNVSIGLCKKAVEWMKEKELIFGMNQAQVLLKRLVGFLNRGFC